MSVKFITCIYGDLYGTELGGRPSRFGHYLNSLLSLLKMTDADFVCYTSTRELDKLKNFFYVENNISEDKLKFELSNLRTTRYESLLQKYKNYESAKTSDRCFEIQYQKFSWWWNEDKKYDYYYWIDAGLSHSGLIPNKYLPIENGNRKFYESPLFNNDFLKNLKEFSGDKFFLIGKDNDRNFWSQTVDPKWYKNYERNIHIIGGLFGGKKELWDTLVPMFENYVDTIIEEDKRPFPEELFMTLMYHNHPEYFVRKHFDTWWCRDNAPRETPDSYFVENKSFYKILEELNNINE
jgi:hypothetical protein